MSSWLIIVTGLIYLYVSVEMIYSGKLGLGLAYAGYAFSNVGLWLASQN